MQQLINSNVSILFIGHTRFYIIYSVIFVPASYKAMWCTRSATN